MKVIIPSSRSKNIRLMSRIASFSEAIIVLLSLLFHEEGEFAKLISFDLPILGKIAYNILLGVVIFKILVGLLLLKTAFTPMLIEASAKRSIDTYGTTEALKLAGSKNKFSNYIITIIVLIALIGNGWFGIALCFMVMLLTVIFYNAELQSTIKRIHYKKMVKRV